MRREPCPKCGLVRPLFPGIERADGSRYERVGQSSSRPTVRLCTDCFCDWLDAEVVTAPLEGPPHA